MRWTPKGRASYGEADLTRSARPSVLEASNKRGWGKGVGHVVEPGHTPGREVAAVETGIDGANRHDEAEPVDGCHAATPRFSEREGAVEVDESGIGSGESFCSEVVAGDEVESLPCQCRDVLIDEGPVADVAGLGNEYCTQAGG